MRLSPCGPARHWNSLLKECRWAAAREEEADVAELPLRRQADQAEAHPVRESLAGLAPRFRIRIRRRSLPTGLPPTRMCAWRITWYRRSRNGRLRRPPPRVDIRDR